MLALVLISLLGGTPECARPELRVYKKEGTLELWCDGTLRRSMAATFGATPLGHKQQRGDERTPEGRYKISGKWKSKKFHRFLHIDYPNADDRARAKERGVDPGGSIGVHGAPKNLAWASDAWLAVGRGLGLSGSWGPTDGCIGLRNDDAELLYQVIPIGTEIVIRPERATSGEPDAGKGTPIR